MHNDGSDQQPPGVASTLANQTHRKAGRERKMRSRWYWRDKYVEVVQAARGRTEQRQIFGGGGRSLRRGHIAMCVSVNVGGDRVEIEGDVEEVNSSKEP